MSKRPHNRLELFSIRICRPGVESSSDNHLFREGVDPDKLAWNEKWKYLRWFHEGIHWLASNGLIALQEWTALDSGAYAASYAVFDAETGEEIKLEQPLDKVAGGDLEVALESLRPSRKSAESGVVPRDAP
jgi:hypothetical protein